MMREMERRLLQIAVAFACLVPLTVGGLSVVRGPAYLLGQHAGAMAIPTDLDSHFRYVSGIFFAVGVAFTTCVPSIEAKGPRFRLLGAFVIAGGLARLLSLVLVGPPGKGHIFGLVMELGVVPLLMLWQARVARLSGRHT